MGARLFMIALMGFWQHSALGGEKRDFDSCRIDPRVAEHLVEAERIASFTDDVREILVLPGVRFIKKNQKLAVTSLVCYAQSPSLSDFAIGGFVVSMQVLAPGSYLQIVEALAAGERQNIVRRGWTLMAIAPPEPFAQYAIRRYQSPQFQRFFSQLQSSTLPGEPMYRWLNAGRCIYGAEVWFDYTTQPRTCNGLAETAPLKGSRSKAN